MFSRDVAAQIPHRSMQEDGHLGCIYFKSLRECENYPHLSSVLRSFFYTFNIPFFVENRAIRNFDERVIPYALP